MKKLLYIFMVVATIAICSCSNSSTKNSSDDSLTEFQRACLDTMNEDPVVSEETEYEDTTKLFAEQERQGTRDLHAKYTFKDHFGDEYTLSLKTDGTVVVDNDGHTYYGSWKEDPDGIELTFAYGRGPSISTHRCLYSKIRDGYFYWESLDAQSKDPEMRIAVKKVQ